MTITIQIGNSDDKLTQKEWSEYVERVNHVITPLANITIHFFGASNGWAPWQNACWVIETRSGVATRILVDNLVRIRKQYNQESIAWTAGKTRFV